MTPPSCVKLSVHARMAVFLLLKQPRGSARIRLGTFSVHIIINSEKGDCCEQSY